MKSYSCIKLCSENNRTLKAHKHLHYNVALVDKVWNLKRLCETHLKMHIPLNMVLKDEEYRADLLEKALKTDNEELVALVWDIRKMEDAILQSSSDVDSLKVRKKSRKAVHLRILASTDITNWPQLGGKDIAIKIYARDEKSGTWDSFKAMVLDSHKAKLSESAIRVESSSELSDSVARENGAIGFIGLPYVRHARLIAVASSDKNKAIMPTHFTVGTEDYPLSRRLFFYTPQINPNIEAQEFVHFVATERGQSIVEDVGFVPQNIKLGKPFDNDFYPSEMRELTARSERLSINFRFKSGSDELDTKSLNDLDRVARYVDVNAPKRVQLFGFSDSEGDSGKGKELSERRAKVVEQLLIQRGIYPLIAKGMGDTAPLAASNTEEGKNINRRVEVWIL